MHDEIGTVIHFDKVCPAGDYSNIHRYGIPVSIGNEHHIKATIYFNNNKINSLLLNGK